MTKFTKGEWEVFGDWGIRAKKANGQLCENNCHATFEYSRGAEGEGFANASLIATAPDMYAMLEGMYETLCLIGDDGEEVEEIKLLLTKARGEIK